MADEIKEWKPNHPRLAAIGEFLRAVSESSALGKFLLEGKADLADRVAYGQPLTTGKGMTTGLRSEAVEAADFLPTGTLAKGAKLAGVIGPIGITNLGDSMVTQRYGRLLEALGKMNPKDWRGQAALAADKGFVPIPRGRDVEPNRPIIKVGYEMPEYALPKKDFAEHASFGAQYRSPFAGAVDAPELLRAYPEMAKAPVFVRPRFDPGSGQFNPTSKSLSFGPSDPDALSQTMKHEIQHSIQAREGWPGGTNSAQARELMDYMGDAPHYFDPKQINRLSEFVRAHPDNRSQSLAYELYRREAGEQLAEAVGLRAFNRAGRVEDRYTVGPGKMYDMREFLPSSFPPYAASEGKKNLPALLREEGKEVDKGRRHFLMSSGSRALANLPDAVSPGAATALRSLVAEGGSMAGPMSFVAQMKDFINPGNIRKVIDHWGGYNGILPDKAYDMGIHNYLTEEFSKLMSQPKTQELIVKAFKGKEPRTDLFERMFKQDPSDEWLKLHASNDARPFTNDFLDTEAAARKWAAKPENLKLAEEFVITGKIPSGASAEAAKYLPHVTSTDLQGTNTDVGRFLDHIAPLFGEF